MSDNDPKQLQPHLLWFLANVRELEWGRWVPSVEYPDQHRHVPYGMWRFKESDGSVEAAIGAAVQSFHGHVAWEMYPAGRNWIIAPMRIREFQREHEGMKRDDACLALAEEAPEFCQAANAEISALGRHIHTRLRELGVISQDVVPEK